VQALACRQAIRDLAEFAEVFATARQRPGVRALLRRFHFRAPTLLFEMLYRPHYKRVRPPFA